MSATQRPTPVPLPPAPQPLVVTPVRPRDEQPTQGDPAPAPQTDAIPPEHARPGWRTRRLAGGWVSEPDPDALPADPSLEPEPGTP